MPISPTVVRVETWVSSPLKTSPSGVRTWASRVSRPPAMCQLLVALGLLRALVALLGLLLLAFVLRLLLFGLGLSAVAAGVLDHLVDRALHVEGLLGQVVVLAVEDLAEAADRLPDRDVHAVAAGELLRDEERLREETLDLAGAVDGQTVLVRQLLDPEDGDDVLELPVALEDLLDLGGGAVVILAQDLGLEDRGRRVKRVDGRIDPLLGDLPRQSRRRVQVREHRRRRRVREVVRGDVDRLDRRHRALLGRGDPLLELAHLGLERRLVADSGGHPTQQRRHLGARLDEPEDVVDEEQHVLAALLAEVLGHRQARERHAKARARRLVHLPEDEHGALEDAGFLHLQPQVVALAGALSDATEGRAALVLLRDVADQLLDQDRLADARAPEQTDLAALRVRRKKVDHLDAGLQDLLGRGQILDLRRRPVDRPAGDVRDLLALVDRLAEEVEDATERLVADRDGDGPAGVDDLVAAAKAVGRVHRHRLEAIVAQMLLDLEHEVESLAPLALGNLDLERVVDLGQILVGEGDVDDHAGHLLDGPYSLPVSVVLSHSSPFQSR